MNHIINDQEVISNFVHDVVVEKDLQRLILYNYELISPKNNLW